METVVKELEAVISKLQRKVDFATKDRDAAMQMLEQARQFGKSTFLTIAARIVQPGDYKGMKPAQAIEELLKSRANSGMSQADIADVLVAEGTVLKGKKYPKRAVALAIVNCRDVFEKRDGLIYLKR
ncbi:MAG TPA: hypothetical protein VJP02_13115 [Candidatus Sulfotelmatobacter sp.]|nr:hypothetical protein [Candidatus Sulfotelmatobacter sp.]